MLRMETHLVRVLEKSFGVDLTAQGMRDFSLIVLLFPLVFRDQLTLSVTMIMMLASFVLVRTLNFLSLILILVFVCLIRT